MDHLLLGVWSPHNLKRITRTSFLGITDQQSKTFAFLRQDLQTKPQVQVNIIDGYEKKDYMLRKRLKEYFLLW